MSLYTLALFAHIVGVLGLFIGMAVQWTIALRLRSARTVAEVRTWSSLNGGAGRLGPVSGALLLVAGIYMMAVAWGMTPWIAVALAALLLMMALGMGVTTRRLKAIQRAAAATVKASTEVVPPELRQQIHNPLLWIATQMAGSTALGVVFLMTIKPSLGGSLLVMGVALILGGIVGSMSSTRPHELLAELRTRLMAS